MRRPSTVGRKPTSSRWPAQPRLTGRRAGACVCSPMNWFGGRWSGPSPMRPSAAPSKKRRQAASERAVVLCPNRRSGLCRRHGGCTGRLRAALRIGSVPRRDQPTTPCRHPATPARRARAGRPTRSRVRPGRRGQRLSGHGAAAGWRHVTVSEQRTRLDFAHCVRDLVDVYYPNADRIVLVLDQLNTTRMMPHPCMRPAAPRRPAAGREGGMAPRPQARQLADHGRAGTGAERAGAVVPAAAAAGPGNDAPGRDGVGRPAQRDRRPDRLAVCDRRRPHRAPLPLPSN